MPTHIKADNRARTVKQLVALALEGAIRMPAFQRPPAWRSSHVIALLDSIRLGYPIGSLLLSEGDAPASPVRFGARQVDGVKRPGAWWVVDGQQRLTALVATLEHPHTEPKMDIHAIWFDLETQQFFRNDGRRELQLAVPVNALGNHTRLLRWADNFLLKQERPDIINTAFECAEAILQYSISTYVAAGASEQDLREIFRRANTSGVALTEAQVFDGLYRGTGVGIDSLKLALADVGLDDDDDKTEAILLKSYAAVGGFSTEDLTRHQPDKSIILKTESALRETINFLASAHFPNIHFVPHRPIIAVLARYFSIFPLPPAPARQFLAWFVWRGALSGAHGQLTPTRMQLLLDAIHDNAEDTALRLLDTVEAHPSTDIDWLAERWNARNKHTRIAACVLWAEAPLLVEPTSPLSEVFQQCIELPAKPLASFGSKAAAPATTDINDRAIQLAHLSSGLLHAWAGIDAPQRRSVARLDALMNGTP